MQALDKIIAGVELDRLRSAYDRHAFLQLERDVTSDAYPPLAAWVNAAADMLYADTPIAPHMRELCLITLLSYRAPGLPLAVHVYWGLMEGLTIEQVLHAASLAGCYGGLPTVAASFVVIQRAFGLLRDLARKAEPCGGDRVLATFAQDFARATI